ncbi:MAG TPA: tRNA (adenosine(37)-N6)-threonylcarbamoyltransferase complex dimerization subunit type 1 TsaB [Kofleriaceae bacterium]
MKVLGIDSASGIASVAVLDGEVVLAETRSETAGHRADLLVLVDTVCTAAGITARELDGVAIGAGPGTFTGLRIGMATAKGIAFAAQRPLWAVSSLAALAHAELEVDPTGVVVGVLDARRGEVYAGAYRSDARSITLVGEERVLPPRELVAFVAGLAAQRDETGSMTRGGARFTGDAADAYPELAQLPGAWARTPSGVSVAKLAIAGARVDVLVNGAPTYIRPSEAEVKYPDGVPGALRKR